MPVEAQNFRIRFLELPLASGPSSLLGIGPQNHGQSDLTKKIEQTREPFPVVQLSRFKFHDPPQYKREHAAECVDMDLLVGPMVLWTRRHMFIVFELAKSFLHFALSAIGKYNVFIGPIVPIGYQNSFAEDFLL